MQPILSDRQALETMRQQLSVQGQKLEALATHAIHSDVRALRHDIANTATVLLLMEQAIIDYLKEEDQSDASSITSPSPPSASTTSTTSS